MGYAKFSIPHVCPVAGFVGLGQSATPSAGTNPPSAVNNTQEKPQHGPAQESIAALQQLAAQLPPGERRKPRPGIAYYRAGKLIDADHCFEIAMAEDPADLESVQMRGLTLYRLGQPAAAIPFLERVRQWMPNANADANHVLGLRT